MTPKFVYLAGNFINLNAIASVSLDQTPPSYIDKDRTVRVSLIVPESISDSLEGLRGETTWYTLEESKGLIEYLQTSSI